MVVTTMVLFSIVSLGSTDNCEDCRLKLRLFFKKFNLKGYRANFYFLCSVNFLLNCIKGHNFDCNASCSTSICSNKHRQSYLKSFILIWLKMTFSNPPTPLKFGKFHTSFSWNLPLRKSKEMRQAQVPYFHEEIAEKNYPGTIRVRKNKG